MTQDDIIYGERIRLRPLTMDDLERCTTWAQDPEVVRHVIMDPVESLEQERKWLHEVLRSPTEHVYIIEIQESKTPIGTCGIHEVPKEKALRNEEGLSLGIMIGEKQYWGQGYGTEVMVLLAEHAFEHFNAHRVWLAVDTVHVRAIRAYKNAGFTLVREIKNAKRKFSNGRQCIMEKRFAYH